MLSVSKLLYIKIPWVAEGRDKGGHLPSGPAVRFLVIYNISILCVRELQNITLGHPGHFCRVVHS